MCGCGALPVRVCAGVADVANLPTSVPKVNPVSLLNVPFLRLESAPRALKVRRCPIDGTLMDVAGRCVEGLRLLT